MLAGTPGAASSSSACSPASSAAVTAPLRAVRRPDHSVRRCRTSSLPACSRLEADKVAGLDGAVGGVRVGARPRAVGRRRNAARAAVDHRARDGLGEVASVGAGRRIFRGVRSRLGGLRGALEQVDLCRQLPGPVTFIQFAALAQPGPARRRRRCRSAPRFPVHVSPTVAPSRPTAAGDRDDLAGVACSPGLVAGAERPRRPRRRTGRHRRSPRAAAPTRRRAQRRRGPAAAEAHSRSRPPRSTRCRARHAHAAVSARVLHVGGHEPPGVERGSRQAVAARAGRSRTGPGRSLARRAGVRGPVSVLIALPSFRASLRGHLFREIGPRVEVLLDRVRRTAGRRGWPRPLPRRPPPLEDLGALPIRFLSLQPACWSRRVKPTASDVRVQLRPLEPGETRLPCYGPARPRTAGHVGAGRVAAGALRDPADIYDS